ncbi:MAG: hypothetical protein AB7S38_28725 [Vulcanimicrobiota bacterium]
MRHQNLIQAIINGAAGQILDRLPDELVTDQLRRNIVSDLTSLVEVAFEMEHRGPARKPCVELVSPLGNWGQN